MHRKTDGSYASNGHPSYTQPLSDTLSTFSGDAAFGKEQSKQVGGDPKVLENFLMMFYDQDNITASLRQEINENNRETARHNAEINHFEGLIEGLNSKANNLTTERDRLITERQSEIAAKRVEIKRIKGGDYTLLGTQEHPSNRLAYWIAAPILILLSVYLILFYASVVYNAFLLDPLELAATQVANNIFSTVTIANVRAFPMAYQEYGVLGLFFLLSGAFVFITLGFLLYWFQRSKARGWSYILYIFTLVFDIILAFEIVKKIHESKALVGQAEPWQNSMAFENMAFYIIIFAGFGMYLAWGFLLQYILEEYRRVLPAQAGIKRRRAEIKRLEGEIQEAKAKFDELIGELKAEVEGLEQQEVGFHKNELEKKNNHVSALKEKLRGHLQNSGTSAQKLRVQITSFFTGWCTSIHEVHAANPEEAQKLVAACHQVVEGFYENIGLN